MNGLRFTANFLKPLALALLLLCRFPCSVHAAADMEELLPPVICGAGWLSEGQPVFYERETLSDRINGEAELYYPYGFDRLAAARYVSQKNPGAGMDVEIYRLGSPLDAFGMFANYRQKEGHTLIIGADANLSGAQLFLYQGRHFVHIQITGAATADRIALAACGRAVASRIPGNNSRPPELGVFANLETVKGSERYLPESLLGYDFLTKGLITDAVINGANLQVFTLLGATGETASIAFNRFSSLMAATRLDPGKGSALFLEGVDPLFGPMVIMKRNNCLVGALKFTAKKGVRPLLEHLCGQ